MRCLIVKNDGIGDLILCSGIIRAISKQFEKLDVLTCIENQGLRSFMPYVDNFYYVSRETAQWSKSNNTFENINEADVDIIDQVSKENYDIVIVLRRFIRSSTFFIASNIKAKRVIYCWKFPTDISEETAISLSGESEILNVSDSFIHEISYYGESLRQFIKDESIEPYLDIKNENITKDPLGVVVNLSSKGWDDQLNWLEVIDHLVEQKYKVTIVGHYDALEISSAIIQRYPHINNLVGRLNIQQWPELLAQNSTYIGNDTGMSHMAMFCSDNIVVHHGGGGIGRFFPWPGHSKAKLVFHSMPCFDCAWLCNNKKLRSCLNQVKPIDIINALNQDNTEKFIFDRNDKQLYIKHAHTIMNNEFFTALSLDPFIENQYKPVYNIRILLDQMFSKIFGSLKFKKFLKRFYQVVNALPRFLSILRLIVARWLRVYRNHGGKETVRLFLSKIVLILIDNDKIRDKIFKDEARKQSLNNFFYQYIKHQNQINGAEILSSSDFQDWGEQTIKINQKKPIFRIEDVSRLLEHLPQKIKNQITLEIQLSKKQGVYYPEQIDTVIQKILNSWLVKDEVPEYSVFAQKGNNRLSFSPKLLEEQPEILDKIWGKEEYFFKADNPSPYILDLGSNIGLSISYFKSLYPDARIIAFEPNPVFTPFHEKMIIDRGWDDTVSIHEPKLIGNNSKPNDTQPNHENITSSTLSELITEEVDLLKLDIEGAEPEALLEIKEKLNLIKNIICEFHVIRKTGYNQMFALIDFLENNGFETFFKESLASEEKDEFRPSRLDSPNHSYIIFAKRVKS